MSRRLGVVCEECGNHAVAPAVVEGIRLLQCTLCGTLAGDDDAIAQANERRAAREAGFEWQIWPLVRRINALRGVTVESAAAGDAFTRTPPFVRFQINDGRLAQLDNLVRVIELVRRELSARWSVHALITSTLAFDLTPIVEVARLTDDAVDRLNADAARIGDELERSTSRTWWKK